MLKRIAATCSIFIMSSSVAFAGAYLGASLSYLHVTNSDETDVYNGLTPKLTVGYGDIALGFLGSVYLAVEAWVMPLQPATINHISTTDFTLKPNYSYGASLLAGINLDGAVKLYGRLGLIRTHFCSANGAQGGLGLEAKFYGPWAGRIEYIRTQFTSTVDSVGRPRIDEGDLTIIYNFYC